MRRFPVNHSKIIDNQVNISGSDYNHIVKVLRLKQGDEVGLFDETGREYLGEITQINSREVIISISATKSIETESKLSITLLQGIPKGDKMDLIIEKATELGVKQIVPVVTERSQIRYTHKIQRWRRIAAESLKQCRRFNAPKINEVVNFDQALKNNINSQLSLIVYEKSQVNLKYKIRNASQCIDNISIIVGPEGGFSGEEVTIAEESGFIQIGLGPRILRTETAAIAMISILQFEFGDI